MSRCTDNSRTVLKNPRLSQQLAWSTRLQSNGLLTLGPDPNKNASASSTIFMPERISCLRVKDCPKPFKRGFYVLPANESMKNRALSVSAKSLQPSKDAWHLLGGWGPGA